MSIEPEPYATKAWLLDGPIHSLPGLLNWDGRSLSFIAYGSGTYSKKGLTECVLSHGQAAEIAEQIWAEEPNTVFTLGPNSLSNYKFPWYYFKKGVKLDHQGRELRISFIQPQNTKLPPRLVGLVASELLAGIGQPNFTAERADAKRWESIFQSLKA